MGGLSQEEVKRRMDPKHLTEMKEELEAEAAEQPKPAEKPAPVDPKTERVYPFDFKWRDGRGKLWEGKFENTAPDIRTRQLIGTLRSQLSGNLPFESLDPVTREMNLVVAHLTFSLTKRPKWAEDVSTLFDYQLLQAIYEEVATHEATFLGYQPAATSS